MKIELSGAVKRRFKVHLRRAGRREIGGVLMAEQIGVDHFRIIDFSVDDQTGGPAHFVRSPEYHQKALANFFARTGENYARFNYLGEWHSHPSFAVRPSTEDSSSMMSLVQGERGITFAALLIVRLRHWFSLDYSITMFVADQSS
ncbi:Mov34/MPN/PAD-1 family protein [Ancylobacter sp.]|uniref:Mov34/MPN/PAD-1 family protein n=1 Tax=Ancylobacter sp. TaxID=1872567 RepID=UPI003C7DE8DF